MLMKKAEISKNKIFDDNCSDNYKNVPIILTRKLDNTNKKAAISKHIIYIEWEMYVNI